MADANQTFSADELKKFDAYERVRQSGRFNMFDPRAIKASRLTKDDYLFVMRNYSALRAARTAIARVTEG